jgi:hypothetical protein
MLEVMSTSSGEVVFTFSRIDPTEFDGAPLLSGVPTVRKLDDCTGGLHDGNASGAPCVLFGVPHALKDGTSEARSGLAPLGRTCEPLATWLTAMSPSAPTARASGSTIFLLMVI